VKLPDTNVLLYAVDAQAAQHRTAVTWLEAA
jgi:predicted nucleic acid-binding protein